MARAPTGQVLERERMGGRVFAIRFRAYGKRRYVTTSAQTRQEAEQELQNVLADVRRGIWREPEPTPISEPRQTPTFHEFASEWVDRRRHEVDERTAEHWTWALSCHVLPHFAAYALPQITPELVDRYTAAKVRERTLLEDELKRWQRAEPQTRGPRPARPLSNGSVNKTLKVLAAILDDAIDYGYMRSNPARGKKRRLKAGKPSRTWLEPDEIRALLNAAGDEHRALLATMTLAGLRVGELCSLRWRSVDLARGVLRVEDAKTDAGRRTVDLSPDLREELTLHRAAAANTDGDALVFPTSRGTKRDRSNILRDVLRPAVTTANTNRATAGLSPITDGLTNHSLRRTFCALLFESGASPAYVMAQMGHTNATLALEVYSKVMQRKRDTGERMDALIRGAEWAALGSNSTNGSEPVATEENKNPVEAGLS